MVEALNFFVGVETVVKMTPDFCSVEKAGE
jgi:hypothetical protein